MEQHEKIWVPEKRKKPGDLIVGLFIYEDAGLEVHEQVCEKENVIVLTLEEFREVWDAAEAYFADVCYEFDHPGEGKATAPDLNAYLQSKGLQLPEKKQTDARR